jgi:hypothetical protein
MKNATILKEAGYEIGGTGGGCESWIIEKNGYTVLIGSDSMADVDDKETLEQCGLVWNLSNDVEGFDYIQGHSPKRNIHNILKMVDFLVGLDHKQITFLNDKFGDIDERTDEWAESDFLYARGILHGIDKDPTEALLKEINETVEALKSLIGDWERDKIGIYDMEKTLDNIFKQFKYVR